MAVSVVDTSLPSLAEDGCTPMEMGIPEIRQMLDTSGGSPRQGNGGGSEKVLGRETQSGP